MDFKEELEKYKQIIDKELQKHIRKEPCLEKVLNESIEYSLMAGGKRLRPIIVIATYKLFKPDYEKCLPYAVAIEMVHKFSLIHDDLPGIDNDEFRHGKLTNHKKFNEATAILAGDSLLNNAYMLISKNLKNIDKQDLNSHLIIFEEFANSVDRMIVGEYVDTEYEKKQIKKEELKYIHKNKTGALLKLCVRMGAILAKATDKQLKDLTCYAEKIGLAFQIKDDILSEEGNEKILGKPVGNDRKLEKCTYVSQYGLESAKDILEEITKEAVKLLDDYGQKTEFLKQLAIYIKDRNK